MEKLTHYGKARHSQLRTVAGLGSNDGGSHRAPQVGFAHPGSGSCLRLAFDIAQPLLDRDETLVESANQDFVGPKRDSKLTAQT